MNPPVSIEIGSQIIMLLAALMLVMQLLLVVQQMLLTNVRLFALQSLMLSAIAAVVAYYYNATHIYIVAVLTLVGKVIFLPWLLNRLVRRINIVQEIEPLFNAPTSMLICGGLTLLGYLVARPFTTLHKLGNNTLAIAITLLLTGFFLMINRRKAITQVLALLTMENGVMLAAVALTTYGMPLVVELGIFFDVMVAVMVLGILVYRIRETFASMDTSKLNQLKGKAEYGANIEHSTSNIEIQCRKKKSNASNTNARILKPRTTRSFAGFIKLGIECWTLNVDVFSDSPSAFAFTMLLLTPILVIPLAAALLCLATSSRWRRLMEGSTCWLLPPRWRWASSCSRSAGPHRGDGMEGIFLRRRAERVDGAADFGGVARHLALRRTLFPPRPRRRGGDGRPRQGVLRAHAGVCHRHVPGGAGEQPGRDVVRAGSHRVVVRAAGGALQPPDLARSGVEIRHARQPGPGAGVVRHGVHLRRGDWTGRSADGCRVSTGRT